MKFEEIEKRFGDYINNKEEAVGDLGSDNLFENRILPQIAKNMSPVRKTHSFWWAVAATSIIALISLIGLRTINQKNIEIALLKSSLDQKDIANNSNLMQLIQLQNELVTSKKIIPKTDTVYKTQVVYRPLNVLPSPPLTVIDDTTLNSDELILMTDDSFNSTKDNTQPDSLKINVLNNFDEIIANEAFSSDSTYDIIQFKIDFGNIDTDDPDDERSWKIKMTYL